MVKPKIPYITGFRKIGGKAIFAKFSKKLYSYILLKTSALGIRAILAPFCRVPRAHGMLLGDLIIQTFTLFRSQP